MKKSGVFLLIQPKKRARSNSMRMRRKRPHTTDGSLSPINISKRLNRSKSVVILQKLRNENKELRKRNRLLKLQINEIRMRLHISQNSNLQNVSREKNQKFEILNEENVKRKLISLQQSYESKMSKQRVILRMKVHLLNVRNEIIHELLDLCEARNFSIARFRIVLINFNREFDSLLMGFEKKIPKVIAGQVNNMRRNIVSMINIQHREAEKERICVNLPVVKLGGTKSCPSPALAQYGSLFDRKILNISDRRVFCKSRKSFLSSGGGLGFGKEKSF